MLDCWQQHRYSQENWNSKCVFLAEDVRFWGVKGTFYHMCLCSLFFEYWVGCRAKLAFTLNQRAFSAGSHIALSLCPYLGSVITATWVMTSSQTGGKGSFQKEELDQDPGFHRKGCVKKKKKKNLQVIDISGFLGDWIETCLDPSNSEVCCPQGGMGSVPAVPFFQYLSEIILFPIGKYPIYSHISKNTVAQSPKSTAAQD